MEHILIILSHRGYWLEPHEKNCRAAFERSFSLCFGTETDIRDHNSKLVISHDIPSSDPLSVEEFFDVYNEYNARPPLALNIKADGLQHELARLLRLYQIENYFVFDMAVPDGILYCIQGFRTFTRQSEYEVTPAFYELSSGVWLDEFMGHWISAEIIQDHLSREKLLCIVSPELHGRRHQEEWSHYRDIDRALNTDRLMLCTDLPELAQKYFNA